VNYGTISQCYTTGDIAWDTSDKGENLAGIVGDMEGGTISDCYSTVNVDAGKKSAGFVGKMKLGSINRCYSTGLVICPDTPGA
ncbi:unnamed protein product, partial [marine sediment metagenome]